MALDSTYGTESVYPDHRIPRTPDWREMDFFLESSRLVTNNASCVVAVVPTIWLKRIEQNIMVIKNKETLEFRLMREFNVHSVSKEIFGLDQYSLAIGSGILISDTQVLTSRHILKSPYKDGSGKFREYLPSELSFIRGFQYDRRGHVDIVFEPGQVHYANSFQKSASSREDWAVINLKKNVEVSLVYPNLDHMKPAEAGEPLYMIGHPLGLPMKFTFNSSVNHPFHTHQFFSCNLDAFGGNSGAPVFREKDHKMIGIFKGGRRDFRKKNNHLEVLFYPDDQGGELCQRLTTIQPF